MDLLTIHHEMAKLRIEQLHEEAARERLARAARTTGNDDEQETAVWRRWSLRRVVGRISLATAGA